MMPAWIMKLMAEERARNSSIESMLNSAVLNLSSGRVAYCPSSGRYRDTTNGHYISGESKQNICEDQSLKYALRQGKFFYRISHLKK